MCPAYNTLLITHTRPSSDNHYASYTLDLHKTIFAVSIPSLGCLYYTTPSLNLVMLHTMFHNRTENSLRKRMVRFSLAEMMMIKSGKQYKKNKPGNSKS